MNTACRKILFVDDEPAQLKGYERMLRREFEIETALDGPTALEMIAQRGPYAVLVSDMRMPQMSGVDLLSVVKTQAPDTVRMMLTGANEIQVAMQAVNEGRIFRFLTKPVTKEALAGAIAAGLLQYRLIVAERELLDRTLGELRQSEELYRNLVQTANEGVWTINTESRVMFANAKLAKMLSCRSEEIVGNSVFSWLDQEGQHLMLGILARNRSGERAEAEIKLLRKDGSELWTTVSSSPILTRTGLYAGSLGMLEDISSRKRAEEPGTTTSAGPVG